MVLTKGGWCDPISKRSHDREKGKKEGLSKRGLGLLFDTIFTSLAFINLILTLLDQNGTHV